MNDGETDIELTDQISESAIYYSIVFVIFNHGISQMSKKISSTSHVRLGTQITAYLVAKHS